MQKQISYDKIFLIANNSSIQGDVEMNDIFNQATSMNMTGNGSTTKTLITKDTILVGTIAADSSIIIDGGVKGDVYSKNSIELMGKVDGNIKANDVTITDGAVKGDITTEGNILVAGDSVIVGNLFGSSLEFNGKIKGNVRINGHAIIRENAIIHGNLSACNFTVDDGAKIIGFVEILRPVEVSGQPTEKIDEIVDFNDIEIPADAGTPNTASTASAEVPSGAPLLTTVPTGGTEEPAEIEKPAPVIVEAPEEKVEEVVSEEVETVEEETEETVSEDSEEDGGGDSFVDEKQKMLQDLRTRMEKAKKSGQSL